MDLATLAIRVQTIEVRQAQRDLANLQRQGAKTESSLDQLSAAARRLAGYLAAAFAVGKFVNHMNEVTRMAGLYEKFGIVMRQAGSNAGYSAGEMDRFEKSLHKAGISMIEARSTLTSLSTAGIALSNSFKIARAAQDLAVVGGMNSSQAFSNMAIAIQRGSPIMLRTLGLTGVDFPAAYKKMADSIGVAVGRLTEKQRVQARTNAVLERAAAYAGIYEQSMTSAEKALGSLTRHVDNYKVAMGAAFQPAFLSIVNSITDAFKNLKAAVEDPKFQAELTRAGDAFARVFTKIAEMAAEGFPALTKEVANFVVGLEQGTSGLITLLEHLKFVKQGWDELPDVIKHYGLVLAILGGPKIKLISAATIAISALAKELDNLFISSGARDWSLGDNELYENPALWQQKNDIEKMKKLQEEYTKEALKWAHNLKEAMAGTPMLGFTVEEAQEQFLLYDGMRKLVIDIVAELELELSKVEGAVDYITIALQSAEEAAAEALRVFKLFKEGEWEDYSAYRALIAARDAEIARLADLEAAYHKFHASKSEEMSKMGKSQRELHEMEMAQYREEYKEIAGAIEFINQYSAAKKKVWDDADLKSYRDSLSQLTMTERERFDSVMAGLKAQHKGHKEILSVLDEWSAKQHEAWDAAELAAYEQQFVSLMDEFERIGKTDFEKSIMDIDKWATGLLSSLDETKEGYEEIAKAIWAVYDARRQAFEDRRDEDAIKRRMDAYGSMLGDLQEMDTQYFEFKREGLERQAKEFIQHTGDQDLAYRWLNEQMRKLDEERAKSSDKFFDGFDAGLDKMLREWKDFNKSAGKIGFEFVETMSKGFADAINSSMSQILIDGFKGELRSFEDYWKRLWGNLLDVVIQAVAQMVAKMALLKIGNLVMGSGGGGGGGLLGAVAGLISIAGGTGSTGLGSTVDLGTSAYGAANKGYEYAGKLYDWYRGVGANAPTGGTGGYMVSGVERGGSSPQSGGSGGGLFTGTGWGTAIVGGVLAGLSAYLKMDDDRYRSEERWTQTIISGVMTTLATKYGGPVMGAFVGWITQLVIGLEDPKTFVNAGPTSAFKTRERYDTQEFDVDGDLIRQRDMDIEALRSGYYDSVENIYKEAIQTHYEIGTSGFSIGIDSIGRGGIFWREFKDDKGAFQEAELGLAEFVAEYYTAFFDVLEEITGGTLAGFVETLGDMFDGKQVENWMFNKGAGEQIGLWTPDGGGEDYIRRMFDDMTMNLVDFNDRLGNYFMEALSGFTESVDWFTGDFLKGIAVSDEDGNAIEEAAQTWLRAADTLSIVPDSVKRINEMIQEGLTAAEAFGRIEAEVNEVRGMVSNAINAAMQKSIASGNWDNFGAMVASGIENQILTGIANAAASSIINQFMSEAVRMIFNMPMQDLVTALATGGMGIEIFTSKWKEGMKNLKPLFDNMGELLKEIFEGIGGLATDWGFVAPPPPPAYTSYTAPAAQDRSAEILSKKLALELQIAELMNDQNAVQEITNQQRAIELQALRELNPELATLQERLWGLQDDAARAARELEHVNWQQSLDGLSDFDRAVRDYGLSMEDVSAIVDWAANTSIEDFEVAIEGTGRSAEYWQGVISEGSQRLREDAEETARAMEEVAASFRSFVDQWTGSDSSAIGQLGLSDAELVAIGDYMATLKEGTPEYIAAMNALSGMGISVDELGNAALSARAAIEAWNASLKSIQQQALSLTSDAFQKQQEQQKKDLGLAVGAWLQEVFGLQHMNNMEFLNGLMELLATEGGVEYFINALSDITGALPEDIRDALGPFLDILRLILGENKETSTAVKQTQNYSRQMVSYLRTMGGPEQEASITDLLNTMNGLNETLTEMQKIEIARLRENLRSANIQVPGYWYNDGPHWQEAPLFDAPGGGSYPITDMPSLSAFADGEEGLKKHMANAIGQWGNKQDGYGSWKIGGIEEAWGQDDEFITTEKFDKWFDALIANWSHEGSAGGSWDDRSYLQKTLGLTLEDMYRLGELMAQIKDVGEFINSDGSFNKENFSEMYDILRDQSPEDLVALYGDDTAKYLQDMIGLWERFGEEGSDTINELIQQFADWQKRLRNDDPLDSFRFERFTLGNDGEVGIIPERDMESWVDWAKVTDVNSFLDIAEWFGLSMQELMEIIDAANARLEAFANFQDKLNNVSIMDSFDFGTRGMEGWVDWAKVVGIDEFEATRIRLGLSFEDFVAILDAADQRIREIESKRLALSEQLADLLGDETMAAEVLAQQRAIELDAMDESLRPLQERVWALQDEAAAIAKANTAVNDYLSRIKEEQALLEGAYNDAKTEYLRLLKEELQLIQERYDIARQAMDKAIQKERELANARISAADTLDALINRIMGSAQSPVQSMEFFDARYAKLLDNMQNATTAEEISKSASELASFAPEYLDYAAAYGGDYLSLYNQVMEDLRDVEQYQRSEGERQIERLEEIEAILAESEDVLLSIDEALRDYQAAKTALDNNWYAEEIDKLERVEGQLDDIYTAQAAYYAAKIALDNSGYEAEIEFYEALLDSSQSIEALQAAALEAITLLRGDITALDPTTWIDPWPGIPGPIAQPDPWPGIPGPGMPGSPMIDDLLGYATGGIASGPFSGYPAILHGTEAIIPLNGRAIPVEIRGNIGNGNIKVIVKIGDRELRDVTTEIIRTDPEAQHQIRRVANA